ncbi:FACT complex subunit SSRP1-like [Haliotis rufescens]|uniref:FACT complex subunit SSRP1-like n=1 Tax=Haliotis rufescens TaxID=6454 RepID=UPI00201EB484|nr:FACT complex subunit SSRP1-like [Haliotis rufescens]XP_046343339.2 FACT complex subunit SSRP1-like [Haliotis rufescens]
MSDIQEYPDVVQEFRGHLNPGRLKLQSNSVIFKNTKTGKVDQYQSNDITKAQWLKRARGYCLKFKLNNDTIHRYDGFKETDFEKLSGFVSNFYETSLEKVDVSLKGWNYGIAHFQGNALTFEVDKSMSFEVPLTNVSHSTTAKNEVTLEFHLNDDAAVSLTEMRFHIPADNRDAENDPVQEFYKNVLESADIIQATGESIVTLQEIQCLTPRGRYDLKMYPTFLQLHGKTFDYKIPYTTVLRLFLLPHKDGRQMFFVVSLDPPIKQGQTRYHFLILLFNKDDEMSAELNLTDEDIEKKYDGKLTREMSGPDYEVVSRIFKAITTSKITVPGGFVGHSGTQAISCSYKAATGLLYPLERGFIFVHKPPIHIRFDEIAAVNFARSSGNTRSFDFDVESKSGTVYNFVGLEKDEYGKLYDFVAQKKLRVKNIGGKGKKRTQDDDDDVWGSGDEGGEHDAYLERMKEEGKNRQVDDEDDDSDSSDESYNPGGSGSEVAEEYDSNPPTSSTSDSDYSAGSAGSGGDSAAEARREKKKEKKEKKEKKKSKSAKTVKEGRRKRKSKKDRDPNRPKRAQSAYFLWLNESRESIKTEFPGLSITELSKKAGEMWRDMTDKSKYEALAEEAKKEYQAAMEEYKKQKEEEPSADEDDDEDGGGGGSPKKERKKKVSPSPKKLTESRAGAGSDYKSKEFISSSSSSDENKPLKKKAKKEGRKEKRAESSPKGRKSKRGAKRNSGSESEEAELPEDEEILSSPTASEASASESDSD